jgi:NAD(P)-dependent dehydrogenase (short-subunit alcohol dehydrogenase family)
MKTAFITGAAIGQGNFLVKRLAAGGWRVFAAVLPGQATDLTNSDRITLVEQNVADGDSVRNSAETVKKAVGDAPLDLLMNVAGVGDLAVGVMECFSIEGVKRLFDVNTWGQLRNVQAFLPLLRKATPPSRIINYGSGAMLVNPPFAGAYNMSKHAVHGMTLGLRHELAAFGIQVTTIMPGGVKTAMTQDVHARTRLEWSKMPQEMQRVYGPSLENAVTKVMPDLLVSKGSTPEQITDEVMKIIGLRKLKPFYLVGSDARPMGMMRRLLSDSAFEKIIRGVYKIPSPKL